MTELFDQDEPEVVLPDTAQQEDRIQKLEQQIGILVRTCSKLIKLGDERDQATMLLTVTVGEIANVLSEHSIELFELKGEPEKAAELRVKRLDFKARMEEHGFPVEKKGDVE